MFPSDVYVRYPSLNNGLEVTLPTTWPHINLADSPFTHCARIELRDLLLRGTVLIFPAYIYHLLYSPQNIVRLGICVVSAV